MVRYELAKLRRLAIDSQEEFFLADVYEVGPEKIVGRFTEKTNKGLAKRVAEKFFLSDKDSMTTIPNDKITAGEGKFHFSSSEMIKFHNEFKRYSDMKKK